MEQSNYSSPESQVDDSPLQQSMGRNKESLKVKLMLRRPYKQLVAQGIMPPLKTPPAFHEQAKKLERRKTGDLLKAKIQQRPGRDELVRQHILEDVGYVDPSLAERQRMLKKARLADHLNDQLSHRPGPLELIQKNILHTEEPIERAVKEGHISFKATCEGQITKPQHPDHYITFEDDSQNSCSSMASPIIKSCKSATSATTSGSVILASNMLETPSTSAGIVTVSLSLPSNKNAIFVTSSSPIYQNSNSRQYGNLLPSGFTDTRIMQTTVTKFSNTVAGDQKIGTKEIQHKNTPECIENQLLISSSITPSSMSTTRTTLFHLASVASPMSLHLMTPSAQSLSNVSIATLPAPLKTVTCRSSASPISIAAISQQKSDAPGKDKNRKKSKAKNQTKTRTIKFHEYKGPPNAQKVCSLSSGSTLNNNHETSYELLLQQQQLFLQWQVEFKNKYPQLILPAAQKPISLTSNVSSKCGSMNGIRINIPSSICSNKSIHSVEQPPLRPLGKLEDMKVSDLKLELKRRNLPVSGSKPQLIERLKPFIETSSNSPTSSLLSQHVTQMGHILMDTPLPISIDDSSSLKGLDSPKNDGTTSTRLDSPHGSESDESVSPPGDDILTDKYRKKIEELQREILKVRSQQQLQQLHNSSVRAEKLVLQQHLQNKMQQQQLTRQLQRLQHLQQQQNQQVQQQARNLSCQPLNAKASLAAFLQSQPNNSKGIFDPSKLTSFNNKKNQINENNITTVQMPTAIVLNLSKPTKINSSILGALVAQAQSQHITTNITSRTPLSHHDETAKLLKVKIESLPKNTIKSQMVDDVLEILINNGELPPSAAQEPVITTTLNQQTSRSLVINPSSEIPTESHIFSAATNLMDVSQSECDSRGSETRPPPPPPPPPPPLPHATFTIQLPAVLQKLNQKGKSFRSESLVCKVDSNETELLRTQSEEEISTEPQSPQGVSSSNNANLDLKELGLDLDTMDFAQLYCDFDVKMESHQELMDIGDMSMEIDGPDWLESLITQSPTSLNTLTENSLTQNTISSSNTEHMDFFDPLLSNNQDPFDIFNVEDPEFKITSELPLPWDNGKVDFAS